MASAASARDPAMAARHPLRIGLVQDNVVNRMRAMRLLAKMGYRADLAEGGAAVPRREDRQRDAEGPRPVQGRGMDDDPTKPIRVDRLVDALLATQPRKDAQVA